MKTMLRNLFRRTSADPSVVIVCGGRRTGTTLLAAILSSDARTNPLGQEAQILTRIVEAYRWGRENFEDFGQSFFGDLEAYRAFFEETATRFALEVSARISPDGVLVLKNPELSRVLLDVADLFPNAQLLATVRDPRDQVASELEVGARRIATGIGDHNFETRNVVALANHYVTYNREIIDLHRQSPGRIYTVRYEDLILNPEKGLLDLRAATGLNLAFDPSKPWPRVSPLASLDSSPSTSELFGAPIDTRSVGRFRLDLNTAEIAVVEEVCADFMNEFDYHPSV